jgi:hypothetical protein
LQERRGNRAMSGWLLALLAWLVGFPVLVLALAALLTVVRPRPESSAEEADAIPLDLADPRAPARRLDALERPRSS